MLGSQPCLSYTSEVVNSPKACLNNTRRNGGTKLAPNRTSRSSTRGETNVESRYQRRILALLPGHSRLERELAMCGRQVLYVLLCLLTKSHRLVGVFSTIYLLYPPCVVPLERLKLGHACHLQQASTLILSCALPVVKMLIYLAIALFCFQLLAIAQPVHGQCRCFPGDGCWPSREAWNSFNYTLNGRLVASVPLAAPCHESLFGIDYNAAECSKLREDWTLPASQ